MSNKNRALYLLFTHDSPSYLIHLESSQVLRKAGYTLVYKHHFMNDEPPYTMVDYWGAGVYPGSVYTEEGETVQYYVVRTEDTGKLVAYMNGTQKDYCDLMIEGNYTRAAGEHNLSMKEYADGAIKGMHIGRRPKIKYKQELPHTLSQLL